MSKLDDLIQKLCPDGVEYKPLSEIFNTRNGYTPTKKEKNNHFDVHNMVVLFFLGFSNYMCLSFICFLEFYFLYFWSFHL